MNNVIEQDVFHTGYAKLLLYKKKYNGYDIEEDYVCADGFPLGKWLLQIRELWKNGDLLDAQVEKLTRIGLSYETKLQNWELMYIRVKTYLEKYSKLPMGIHCQNEDGVMLGAWLDKQKRFSCYLTSFQKEKLNSLGVNLEE